MRQISVCLPVDHFAFLRRAGRTQAAHIRRALGEYIARRETKPLRPAPPEPESDALRNMALDAAARLHWALSQCRDEQEREQVRGAFDGWKPA